MWGRLGSVFSRIFDALIIACCEKSSDNQMKKAILRGVEAAGVQRRAAEFILPRRRRWVTPQPRGASRRPQFPRDVWKSGSVHCRYINTDFFFPNKSYCESFAPTQERSFAGKSNYYIERILQTMPARPLRCHHSGRKCALPRVSVCVINVHTTDAAFL